MPPDLTPIANAVREPLAALGRGVQAYLGRPVHHTLRLIAVAILVAAALSVVGILFRWQAVQYFTGFAEILFWLAVAWLLTATSWSRVLVALFLLGLFVTTVVLVLVPEYTVIQQLADIYFSVDPNNPAGEVAMQKLLRTIATVWTEGAPFVFTLLMGALGSSIMITRQFIRDFEGKPPIWYVYRLTQGMLMALLVIYGIAAGVIGIGQDNPINVDEYEEIKYMIGFVAALAGLFSEQAFQKLHDVAKSIFGVADDMAKVAP